MKCLPMFYKIPILSHFSGGKEGKKKKSKQKYHLNQNNYFCLLPSCMFTPDMDKDVQVNTELDNAGYLGSICSLIRAH